MAKLQGIHMTLGICRQQGILRYPLVGEGKLQVLGSGGLERCGQRKTQDWD